MNKYEKLIEYIVNDEQDKARALFHDIVVEKSRGIYESLMDDEKGHGMGGDQVEDMVDEISADEEGMHEGEDEFDDMGDYMGDDMGGDDMGDDMGSDDMGDDMGDGDIEDRVQDLESALDELKAEFDQLMSDEAGEEEHGDMDFDSGSDEDMGDDEDMMESEEEEEEEVEDDSVEESRRNMSSAEKIREYVEKVSDAGAKSEGGEVAKGGSVSVNKQSIVAGKNDMGGTASNIVKGGSEQSPDNKPVPKASNAYTKGQGQLKGAGNYENVPGAKTKGYSNKQSAKSGEGSTTDGSVPVQKRSIEPGKK